MTSSGKSATESQSFAAICAYDGHRAGIGRVVTDATWHHFLDVNLIGIPGLADDAPNGWGLGFLYSPEGQAVLEEIKTYHRNLAIWLCRPALISCMQARLLWYTVFNGGVLEAVLTARSIGIERIDVRTLAHIGRHARAALSYLVSHCQTRQLLHELLGDFPDIVEQINPWRTPRRGGKDLDDDELPLFDFNPMLDAALGGALVKLNERFPNGRPTDFEEAGCEAVFRVARTGAAIGIDLARASLQRTIRQVSKLSRPRR